MTDSNTLPSHLCGKVKLTGLNIRKINFPAPLYNHNFEIRIEKIYFFLIEWLNIIEYVNNWKLKLFIPEYSFLFDIMSVYNFFEYSQVVNTQPFNFNLFPLINRIFNEKKGLFIRKSPKNMLFEYVISSANPFLNCDQTASIILALLYVVSNRHAIIK